MGSTWKGSQSAEDTEVGQILKEKVKLSLNVNILESLAKMNLAFCFSCTYLRMNKVNFLILIKIPSHVFVLI